MLRGIVDDIYRSGNYLYYYNEDVAEYLRVTAKVVMNWYRMVHQDTCFCSKWQICSRRVIEMR